MLLLAANPARTDGVCGGESNKVSSAFRRECRKDGAAPDLAIK